jgi:peptide/nickel transport system substrate-binding protein
VQRRLIVAVAFVAASALMLAACSSSAIADANAIGQRPIERLGGTVKWAETAGSSPNYISPLDPGNDMTVDNLSQFQNLLYKPLFVSNYDEPTMNYSRSIANTPVFSDGDRVVTITLKHYLWKNGTPVTTRDITFYINLARAAGPSWGYYVPGDFPYNVKRITVDSPTKMSFTLDRSYNPTYFVDNQLSVITPIPQNDWDRTSLHGRVGNYDETPSGAKKVWDFLTSYAQNTSTYTAQNVIWGDIDGPYELAAFGGDASPDIFLPNPHYSGQRSVIAEFEELPFTSNSAEYDELRSGTSGLTVGFVPPSDVPTLGSIRAAGYRVTAVHDWAVEFLIPNMTNPVLGAAFRQLYLRQALQHLVDQPAMVTDFLHGYGSPTYGPAPIYPKNNPFVDSFELTNPYPYSIAAAERLLASHGWKMVDGVRTCTSSACGPGVAIGTKLDIKLLDPSGSTSITEEAELFEADAARAGIDITLTEEPYSQVLGIVDPCTPGQNGMTASSPGCTWQLGNYEGWSYSLYPSGGEFLLPGSEGNSASYDDVAVNALIKQVRHSSSLAAYHAYENLVAEQVPLIWQPTPDEIVASATNLHGPGIAAEFGDLEPNRWYFTKS